jgi:Rrf2 family transcriptional regulator, iron-sulfur cluster assembly transcription factor
MQSQSDEDNGPEPSSALVDKVIAPAVKTAGEAFLGELDKLTIEDLCNQAEASKAIGTSIDATVDFAI